MSSSSDYASALARIALGAIILAFRYLGYLALKRRFRPRGWA